jgi:hypothetical protein
MATARRCLKPVLSPQKSEESGRRIYSQAGFGVI